MDETKLFKEIPIVIDALSLLAIHGYVCLALRHPQAIGPSRKIGLDFIQKVEERLLKEGVIDQEDIELIHKVEREEILKMRRDCHSEGRKSLEGEGQGIYNKGE